MKNHVLQWGSALRYFFPDNTMPKNQYPTATAYAFQLQCELILSHIRMAINFLQSEIVTVYEKNLFEKFSLLLVPG